MNAESDCGSTPRSRSAWQGPPTRGGDALFGEHRNLLFSIAYDMLSSVTDAEDVVQDTWLRWAEVDQHHVANPRSYLIRITVRRALDMLRQARTARQNYVGPWLPEPFWVAPDAAEELHREETVTFGLLVVLETLSPLERAAFVLHEAFGYDHNEIGRMLDRTPAAARQLTHRARAHVRARRPRYEVDHGTAQRAAKRFLSAGLGGSVTDLLNVLAPEVTLWNDGGGRVRAALRPVRGAEKVARLLATVGRKYARLEVNWIRSAGAPTVLLSRDSTPQMVLILEPDETGHRIRDIYGIVNPHKLSHLYPAPRMDGHDQ